ncbi:2-oxoacid:acceptor oxidoreductase family protein [Desulfogranum mediterraneum]|uniref:2-oxoacid:acceptor oxidoreductase family protein n=1 Tax=Desulfogranum mediterraneum TaxID=160661 RepID=UPI00040E4FB4|nr:2-oxoacid:acceptor oxidoreductase family protein [Desulfogranum mediterraneum]
MKTLKPIIDRYELRFSGSGGQGLITAAVVFADAAGTYDGRYVCQTQSYGPEARGGKSKAEVVLSNSPIDYPKSLNLDLLLAMNQAACDAYFFDLNADGLLLVDSTLVDQYPTSRIIAIPFTEIAKEELGREVVANMVALGAVGRLCERVDLNNLEKALLSRVPKGTESLNSKALQRGIEEAEKINLAELPRSIINEEEEV